MDTDTVINVLVCCHCKERHDAVTLLGRRHSGVSYYVLYLDVSCTNTNDDTQFIGWQDFKNRNVLQYDIIFLMNCPMYIEIKYGPERGAPGFNVWPDIMSEELFRALKPLGQMIFRVDPEFENGIKVMLCKYKRNNDFNVQIKPFDEMDFVAINKHNKNSNSNYYCVLTKKSESLIISNNNNNNNNNNNKIDNEHTKRKRKRPI